MTISKKTQELMLELNEFSGSKLKNIHDLSLLIEIAESNKFGKQFYDILFTAKYLNGLGKILYTNISVASNKNSNGNSNSPANIEAKEKIQIEFKKNIVKLTNDLRKFIENMDENFRNEFGFKYLSLSRESMQNLTTLIYDLSWLKKYYNSKR